MKKKFKIWGIVILTIAIAVVAFAVFATSSVKGTIKPADEGSLRKASGPPPGTVDGKYFKFDYQGGYTLRKNELQDRNAIEQHKLIASTAYEKAITATVKRLPNGDVTEDSAYKLRKTFPDQYTESQMSVKGQTVRVFTKFDGQEQDLFLSKDNLLTTIVLTTGSKEDNIKSEAKTLLDSFQWK